MMGGPVFRVYVANGREYFEFKDRLAGKTQCVRKDFPFLESLLALLYLDAGALEPTVKKIDRAVRNLYESHDGQYISKIEAGLDELAKAHIYFQLPRLEWKARLRQAQAQGYLDAAALPPRKQLLRLPGDTAALQSQLRELFAAVLDAEDRGRSVPERLAEYCAAGKDAPNKFQFQPLTLSPEAVDSQTFAEVLYPKDIHALVEFFLWACVRREQRVRVCKNCGRYFAITGRASAEYCGRPFDGRGRTCKEVGAITQWSKKRSGDEVFKLYRREYKKRFARIRAGKLDAGDFYAWSAQAREKKAACDSGALTLEGFQAWLAGS